MPTLLEILKILNNETYSEKCQPYVFFLIYQINYLFNKIKLSADIYDARESFMLLDKIQFILAKWAYKDGMSIPNCLKKFMKDFDNIDISRIDNESIQQYLFNEIKKGNYNIKFENNIT